MSKIRVGEYLVNEGYFSTIKDVTPIIMARLVFINEQPIYKTGDLIDPKKIKSIRIKGMENKYVSRGGLKLAEAIRVFKLNLNNKIMLDVGASTGGFTDCALQNKIKLVHALDVGTNQLVYKLRQHPQVIVHEKTNFRTVNTELFKNKFDFITMDVSFISTSLLIDNVSKLLKSNGTFICLIKPQFEASKEVVTLNKGIIVDKKIHEQVILDFIYNCQKIELYVNNIVISPIKGGKGNIEFLAQVTKNNHIIFTKKQVENLVFNLK